MPKNDVDEVEYIEQTRQIDDGEGYVTIIERWERARPGEFAPMVFFNRLTGKSVGMKKVGERYKYPKR